MDTALLFLCGGSLLLLVLSLLWPAWVTGVAGRYTGLAVRAFLGAVTLLSLFLLGSSAQTRSALERPLQAVQAKLHAARGPEPGREGRLSGGDTVAMAADGHVYEVLRRAVAAHDVDGLDALMARGQVLPVPGGTRVRVIADRAAGSAVEVQVQEGRYAGKVGWVTPGAVRG